ncbi:ATP-dependent DNA helicase [Heracleum sosnowskyi]|uniref:ATP-dependent DNA helicase n=1 Tax=Heracleum sosnowskyi TaxID=360622 RepID=A0AAD8MTW9_9APIA|nr:ATP-dependent DNA helicase [Heracleum sosnowskyi]
MHWSHVYILYSRRKKTGNQALTMTAYEIENYALAEVEKLLNEVGKSLRDYSTMLYLDEAFLQHSCNRLIEEETSYDKVDMKTQHDRLHSNLNSEQFKVYQSIITSVNSQYGGLYFVYGSGGCGKTYLWKTLCCRLRSEGKIVLPVASSGIAAVLLPGGRTAHSRFQIPIKLDQYSVASIKHGSDFTELIKKTSLIIWDEAPMQHIYGFEAVDRSFRDIMSSVDPKRKKLPFGGITVVFGGDFRQILPVIPKASRSEVVNVLGPKYRRRGVEYDTHK